MRRAPGDRATPAYTGRVIADPASIIDLTLLKPDALASAIDRLTDEAIEYGFASVCVNPRWVPRVAGRLRGTPVRTCTVVGFPLGATTTATKVFETRDALASGADEIDAVIDVAAVKERDDERLRTQLASLVEAVHGGDAQGSAPKASRKILKVIIEVCLLDDDEIAYASRMVADSGADFVKTSTGFSTGGATVHAVRLIRAAVGPTMGIKAAGGIHTPQQFRDLVEAGATRIGASDGRALI